MLKHCHSHSKILITEHAEHALHSVTVSYKTPEGIETEERDELVKHFQIY